jgi:hypothetical protein
MSIPPIVLPTPQILDLVRVYLLSKGIDPIIAGCDSELRFQVLDDLDAAVSLAGASLEMLFNFGAVSVTLNSATLISPGFYEIAVDGNQATEVGDTGKGWYTVNFSSLAGFVTKISPVRGRGTYLINVTLATGKKRRHVMGEYDIL